MGSVRLCARWGRRLNKEPALKTAHRRSVACVWLPTASETQHQHTHTHTHSPAVFTWCQPACRELLGMRPQVLCGTNGLSSSITHHDTQLYKEKFNHINSNRYAETATQFLCLYAAVSNPWLDLSCGRVCKLIANVNQKCVSAEFPSCAGKRSCHCLISCFGQCQLLLFCLLPSLVSPGTSSLTLSTLTAVVVLLLVPLAPYRS